MPKAADPSVRTALLETAAELIATQGSAGLTLRRLADEVGTSTMAVYTHFGGMQNLRQEIRREGFARLRDHLDAVATTADSLADLAWLGWAYYDNAVENPNLYRVMFGEHHEPAGEVMIGIDTFDHLVVAVTRCVADERFTGEAFDLALQLWSVAHGLVSLQLSGLVAAPLAVEMLTHAWRNLFVAFGAEPKVVARAFAKARRPTPPRAARALGSGEGPPR